MVDNPKPKQVACQIRKDCIQNVCDTVPPWADVSFSVGRIPDPLLQASSYMFCCSEIELIFKAFPLGGRGI
jgi:hypothetical protein